MQQLKFIQIKLRKMNKGKIKVINVEKGVKLYNDNVEPELALMELKKVAKESKRNVQVFYDWKAGRTPNWAFYMDGIFDLLKTDLNGITERNEAGEIISLDIDLGIDTWNKNNPELRQLNRKAVADQVGLNVQIFSDWKHKEIPKFIFVLDNILKTLKCDFEAILERHESN
jgi:hypothetical protein